MNSVKKTNRENGYTFDKVIKAYMMIIILYGGHHLIVNC